MREAEDETEQNETMDEAMELELDGMEQRPNDISSEKQNSSDTSLVIINYNKS